MRDFALAICALLAFLLPVGFYCLILASINRRGKPLIVSGVWDSIGLLFAVSGFSMPTFWLGFILVYVFAITAGWLAAFMPKRYILSLIYFGRAAAILVYILLPPSTIVTLIFGAVMGLLWLSTVPPTASLVAIMFGNRWGGMLYGFAFFSHQVGGFLGVWLGGVLFERTGSYDAVWWLSILLGLLSAAINLPIVERPVARLAPATT